MAVGSGTGQGGKSFQDRELAARVRTRALEQLEMVLDDNPEVQNWSEYKKQILSKMSTTILPRLNEHTGEGGEPIKHEVNGTLDKIYGAVGSVPTNG